MGNLAKINNINKRDKMDRKSNKQTESLIPRDTPDFREETHTFISEYINLSPLACKHIAFYLNNQFMKLRGRKFLPLPKLLEFESTEVIESYKPENSLLYNQDEKYDLEVSMAIAAYLYTEHMQTYLNYNPELKAKAEKRCYPRYKDMILPDFELWLTYDYSKYITAFSGVVEDRPLVFIMVNASSSIAYDCVVTKETTKQGLNSEVFKQALEDLTKNNARNELVCGI